MIYKNNFFVFIKYLYFFKISWDILYVYKYFFKLFQNKNLNCHFTLTFILLIKFNVSNLKSWFTSKILLKN